MALKTRYSPLQKLSVENVLTSFGELSSPRKLMALIIAGAAVGLILFLPISFFSGKVQSLRREVMSIQKSYGQVVTKIREYQSLKKETESLEQQFGTPVGSLATRLENIGKEVGVKIDQVKEKAPQETDFLGINSIEVRLSNVTLPQLITLLSALENDKESPMRIRRIDVKPRSNNRQMLTVTFEVATFTLRREV